MQTQRTEGPFLHRDRGGRPDASEPARPARAVAATLGLALLLTTSGCGANGDSIRDMLPHIDGQELSAPKNSCEDALLHAGRAASDVDASGFRAAAMAALAHERDAWIAVGAQCPDRFGEAVMRAALADHAVGVEASMGGLRALGTSLSDDGPLSSSADRSPVASASAASADVIALAEDRAGFGYEVIAARNGREPDDVLASESHRRVASLWTARANGDPRLKVYQTTGLSDGSGMAKVNGTVVPERAAIAMDAALEEINGLADAGLSADDAAARERLAVVVAANAAEAFAAGFPAQEWIVLG